MYFCVKPNTVLRFAGQGWALYRSIKHVVHRNRMRSVRCQDVSTGGGRIPNFRRHP